MTISTNWLASTRIIPAPEGWLMIEIVAISRDRSAAIQGCRYTVQTLTRGCRHYMRRHPAIKNFNPKAGEYVARATIGVCAEPGGHLTVEEAHALQLHFGEVARKEFEAEQVKLAAKTEAVL